MNTTPDTTSPTPSTTGTGAPAITIVIDEATGIVDSQHFPSTARLVAQILQQGRAAGIGVVGGQPTVQDTTATPSTAIAVVAGWQEMTHTQLVAALDDAHAAIVRLCGQVFDLNAEAEGLEDLIAGIERDRDQVLDQVLSLFIPPTHNHNQDQDHGQDGQDGQVGQDVREGQARTDVTGPAPVRSGRGCA